MYRFGPMEYRTGGTRRRPFGKAGIGNMASDFRFHQSRALKNLLSASPAVVLRWACEDTYRRRKKRVTSLHEVKLFQRLRNRPHISVSENFQERMRHNPRPRGRSGVDPAIIPEVPCNGFLAKTNVPRRLKSPRNPGDVL